MYKVYIAGVFRGQSQDLSEVMEIVDRWARPFKKNWKILDRFGKVYAEG